MKKLSSKKLVKKENKLTFSTLISSIQDTDQYFKGQANRAVNVSLTLRNWVIGYYISEYELNGKDRAKYGKKFYVELDERLNKLKISNCRSRQLYYYTAFYRTYPEILRSLTAKYKTVTSKVLSPIKKVRSLTAQMHMDPNEEPRRKQRGIKPKNNSHYAPRGGE